MLKRVFPVAGRHNGYLERDGTISLFLGHSDLFGKSTYERTSLGRIDRIRDSVDFIFYIRRDIFYVRERSFIPGEVNGSDRE